MGFGCKSVKITFNVLHIQEKGKLSKEIQILKLFESILKQE